MFDDMEDLDPRKVLRRPIPSPAAQNPQEIPSIAPPQMAAMKPAVNLPGISPEAAKPAEAAKPMPPGMSPNRQELDRLTNPTMASSKPGVDQFSSHHHIAGPLLKTLDVLGSILVPGAASAIPGTTMHHNALVNRQEGLASAESKQNQQAALADQEQAKADQLRNPQPTPKEEEWSITPDGGARIEKHSGQIVPLDEAHGKPAHGATPEVQSFEAYMKAGMTPQDAFKKVKEDAAGAKPEHLNDFQAFYKDFLDDNKLVDSAHNRLRARTEFAKAGQPFGQQHLDIQLHNQENKDADRRDKKTAPLDGVIDEASHAHDVAKLADSGNAEADVDLALSFFKVMRSGGQGIRFTRQEQDLILGARNSAGDLQGLAQKVIGQGQKFTPQQRQQIIQVIDTHAKAAQMAKERMASGGGAAPGGDGDVIDYVRDAKGNLVPKQGAK